MTTEEKIAVLQAYAEDKKIERRRSSSERWEYLEYPGFDFVRADYRVKQEPREFNVVLTPDGKAVGISPTVNGYIIVHPSDVKLGSTIIKVREVL
jgi:hypothetical protein